MDYTYQSYETFDRGGERYVAVPEREFKRLREQEELAEIRKIIAAVESGAMETYPHALIKEMFALQDAGKSALPLWRKYRKMTQEELAAAVGVKREYISMLEAGKREGTPRTMKAIAKVLKCQVDDIIG